MHVNFNSMNEYRDFLYSEFGNVSGLSESYGDRFAAASKAIERLCDDLSLDNDILDLGGDD